MRIENHLLNDIKPLQDSEKVADVLDIMEELKYSHLPVVDEDRSYLGLLCEDDLLELDEDALIKNHRRCFKPYAISVDSHLFDAIKIIGEGNLSLLPVIDAQSKYLGYLSAVEALQDFGRELSFTETGSVMVLKMEVLDYHLSQIAQIVESEDARIIGLLIFNDPNPDLLNLVLKINQQDLGRIIQSFQRYNYNIDSVYHQSIFDESLADRYESFMKYINI